LLDSLLQETKVSVSEAQLWWSECPRKDISRGSSLQLRLGPLPLLHPSTVTVEVDLSLCRPLLSYVLLAMGVQHPSFQGWEVTGILGLVLRKTCSHQMQCVWNHCIPENWNEEESSVLHLTTRPNISPSHPSSFIFTIYYEASWSRTTPKYYVCISIS